MRIKPCRAAWVKSSCSRRLAAGLALFVAACGSNDSGSSERTCSGNGGQPASCRRRTARKSGSAQEDNRHPDQARRALSRSSREPTSPRSRLTARRASTVSTTTAASRPPDRLRGRDRADRPWPDRLAGEEADRDREVLGIIGNISLIECTVDQTGSSRASTPLAPGAGMTVMCQEAGRASRPAHKRTDRAVNLAAETKSPRRSPRQQSIGLNSA